MDVGQIGMRREAIGNSNKMRVKLNPRDRARGSENCRDRGSKKDKGGRIRDKGRGRGLGRLFFVPVVPIVPKVPGVPGFKSLP